MSHAPQIAVWGMFDADAFGDQLYVRILSQEITRRLPDASVRYFSPAKPRANRRFAMERPCEPLGRLDEQATHRFADTFDLVLVGPGDLIAAESVVAATYGIDTRDWTWPTPGRFLIEGPLRGLEAQCPVVWNCVGVPAELVDVERDQLANAARSHVYLAVRNESSRRKLSGTVDRPIDVVADPLILLPRVFSRQMFGRRLAYLTAISPLPAAAGAVFVEASSETLAYADEIGQAFREVPAERHLPVLVLPRSAPGVELEVARMLKACVAAPVSVIPWETPLEDVVSLLGTAAVAIGASWQVEALSAAYGVPYVRAIPTLESAGDLFDDPIFHVPLADRADVVAAVRRAMTKPLPLPDIGPAVDRLDAHFDKVAAIAERAAWSRASGTHQAPERRGDYVPGADPAYVRVLENAHRVRGRRLIDERERFAGVIEGDHRQLAALRDELREACGRELEARNALASVTVDPDRLSRQIDGAVRDLIGAQLDKAESERAREEGKRRLDEGLRAANSQAEIDRLQQIITEKQAMIERFERSKSWRFFAPARRVAWWYRRRLKRSTAPR